MSEWEDEFELDLSGLMDDDIFVYDDDALMHIGTMDQSGRYKRGSGENPYQHEANFRTGLKRMLARGMTEKEIIKAMGMSSTEFRQMRSISKDKQRQEIANKIVRLKEQGYSNVTIGKMLDPPRNESYVRSVLEPKAADQRNKTENTANFLKEQLKTKRYLDVTKAAEREMTDVLGFKVTEERKNTALLTLQQEGYQVLDVKVPQVTNPGKFTTMKVLCPPGTEWKEVRNNLGDVKSIGDYDNETGMTQLGLKPPVSVDSKRIDIRYAEQGGLAKDGVIELRRGVDDISLGGANYAQVRIAVDGTHYMKGMAVYADDLPDGIDIRFNTNKHEGTPMLSDDPKAKTVFKPMKVDPETGAISTDNPFGATIKKQREYEGADGETKLSAINIVNEEGGWSEYSKTLSAQFLSKQPIPLIKKQLKQAYDERKEEFDQIMSYTNPAVKKKLLEEFAETCDGAAVHLKAAGIAGQAYQVLLPLSTVKDTEIYAPQYEDGTEVCLVRYPHAGIFEIPRLIVNNKLKEGRDVIGAQAKDAVGISTATAAQLSGADFDGDTALVIPTTNAKVRTSAPLDELKNFDPKEAYPGYSGMKALTSDHKQREMGIVTNLITDMTLQGAPPEKLARAVKYSMCIIDAEKHKLDFRKCYQDCKINELKKEYQPEGGVGTLISRAKSPLVVPERKIFNIARDTDPETGEKVYRESGRTYINKEGKRVLATEESSKMAETNDARTLISKANTRTEQIYADYANSMKALANSARKGYLEAGSQKRNPSAVETYAEEVASLKSKLNVALKNSPRERQAQLTANVVVSAKIKSNPELKEKDHKSELKRLKQQALSAARARFGASKQLCQIDISQKEWDAIQAGAVSHSLLMDILNNTDMDRVRSYATPKVTPKITSGKAARIKSLLASGHTMAEVAEAVGVSVSTVNKYAT